ncbi:MAG: diguanylate cyclase [Thiohalocapsa sp.]
MAGAAQGFSESIRNLLVFGRIYGCIGALICFYYHFRWPGRWVDRSSAVPAPGADTSLDGQQGVATPDGTWSCGIAVFPKDGEDDNALIKNADIAMYRAKAKGGNTAVSYDPATSRQMIADLRMRDHLRRAIAAEELFVRYQPFFHAANGEPAGLEALAAPTTGTADAGFVHGHRIAKRTDAGDRPARTQCRP